MPKHTLEERQRAKKIGVAKMRTQDKAAKAGVARLAGGNSTTRMKGKLNITKTAKAFNLARISSMAKKTRSPVGLAFAIGAAALTHKLKPIKGAKARRKALKNKVI